MAQTYGLVKVKEYHKNYNVPMNMWSLFTLNNCGLCKVKLNPKVAEGHYVGKRHKKALNIAHIVNTVNNVSNVKKKVVPRAKTVNKTARKEEMSVKKKVDKEEDMDDLKELLAKEAAEDCDGSWDGTWGQ